MEEDIEPTDEQIKAEPHLQLFKYKHLQKPELRAVSRMFTGLAQNLVDTLPRNAQRTIALNKLREAKDHACTALLWVQPG